MSSRDTKYAISYLKRETAALWKLVAFDIGYCICERRKSQELLAFLDKDC